MGCAGFPNPGQSPPGASRDCCGNLAHSELPRRRLAAVAELVKGPADRIRRGALGGMCKPGNGAKTGCCVGTPLARIRSWRSPRLIGCRLLDGNRDHGQRNVPDESSVTWRDPT